jgi:hypothetical protein
VGPRYALQTPWQGQHRHQHRISASLSLTTVRQSGARSPSSAGTTETPRRGGQPGARRALSYGTRQKGRTRCPTVQRNHFWSVVSVRSMRPFCFFSCPSTWGARSYSGRDGVGASPRWGVVLAQQTRRNPTYLRTGTVSTRDTVLYFVGVGQPSVTFSLSNSAD